jgi:hypothetical protein
VRDAQPPSSLRPLNDIFRYTTEKLLSIIT